MNIHISGMYLTFKVYLSFLISDAVYGVRHTQVILLFAMIVIAYGMRVNLSVAIVAMTDPEASSNPDIPVSSYFLFKGSQTRQLFYRLTIGTILVKYYPPSFGAM